VFHRYAGLDFALLDHEYRLPYPDGSFDAAISGGVLEHVAFEHESLLEVWRILKMGGLFVVTFLPNATSLTENLNRLLGREEAHSRTYDLTMTRNMLLRSGFMLEISGYHQIFPTLGKSASMGGWRAALTRATVPLNRPVERVPGLRAVASNLYLVVRKVNCL
jgi:SAM-dependent methyltransferase